MPRQIGGRKLCPKCEDVKEIVNFDSNRRMSDGLSTYCKSCRRIMGLEGVERRKKKIQQIPSKKVCTKCNIEKPSNDFYINGKWSIDGLQAWCRECTKEKRVESYNKDPEKMKKRGRDNSRNERLQMLEAYGNKCNCCNETELDFLTLDHIYNDGAEDRRNLNNGRKGNNKNLIRKLRKLGYPKDRYQILCFNCNCAKSFYGICPHQRKKGEMICQSS